jgi:predicted transposase YbfD/YdcC
MAVSPEEIGLCGCWQILAIKRERIELAASRAKLPQETMEPEVAYYVTSLCLRETSDRALLDAVRGHWSAIENGVHHTRDTSFGEDASRIAQPTAARVMATLRNLAIGIYNLEQERPDAKMAASLPAWQRKLTASEAIGYIL